MNAVDTAAALGLDPRGYRPEGAQEHIPWDAPASRIMDDEAGDLVQDDGGPADDDYTVLDHLTDLASAQGMFLEEFLTDTLDLDDDEDEYDLD